MKFKTVIPYLLAMSAASFPAAAQAQRNSSRDDSRASRSRLEVPAAVKDLMTMNTNTAKLVVPKLDMEATMQIVDNKSLDGKADELMDAYISNMLDAQQRLFPLLGKRGYAAAVRRELPGAPVGRHCVFGQYTQLARALQEMGDTLTVIPDDASRACKSFKQLMTKKYSAPEFSGAIHNGTMYETNAEYDAALNRYMTAHNITDTKARVKAEQDFARENFSADELSPGTMMVVHNGGHMIMYLGRGRIVNGHFVADKRGRHIYVGHNHERLGDLIKTWGTRNIFASDTRKIVRVLYSKEWNKIEKLNYAALLRYVAPTPAKRMELAGATREQLLDLARDRYFHQALPNYNQPAGKNRGILAQNDAPSQDAQFVILQQSQRTI